MNLPSRLEYHTHYRDIENAGDGEPFIEREDYIEPGCEKCREKFEKSKSLCAFCLGEISNKDFLKNDYHQTGKCKAKYVFKVPEQSWKRPLPYPMPKMPDYSLKIYPQNIEAFRSWWGLDIDWTQRRIEALEKENREFKRRLARRKH